MVEDEHESIIGKLMSYAKVIYFSQYHSLCVSFCLVGPSTDTGTNASIRLVAVIVYYSLCDVYHMVSTYQQSRLLLFLNAINEIVL